MSSAMPFDLTGRVAAITGGNGGIGQAMALGLAKAGASVAILGRNNEKNAATLDLLQKIGNPAQALELDVSRRDALSPSIDRVEAELGPVDILINNAGISALGNVLMPNADNWDQVIEINLTSAYLLSTRVAPGMRDRKRGKIVNITSEYSRFGSAFVPSYSASKGGVLQLTRSMAVELAPFNIQVNSITPGWIETDMTGPVKNSPMNEEILSRTPAGRWGQPDDLAGAAVFLASSASDFITGIEIFVDGGYAIR